MQDTLMVTIYKVTPMSHSIWDNLTDTEQNRLVYLFNMRRNWYRAWDMVEETHKMYNIPYHGPTAFIPDNELIDMERLCCKLWGLRINSN